MSDTINSFASVALIVLILFIVYLILFILSPAIILIVTILCALYFVKNSKGFNSVRKMYNAKSSRISKK